MGTFSILCGEQVDTKKGLPIRQTLLFARNLLSLLNGKITAEAYAILSRVRVRVHYLVVPCAFSCTQRHCAHST